MTEPITDTMMRYLLAGLSVVPIRADGSKRPAVPWAKYQHALATPVEVNDWGDHHIGIIGGAVSGGLEIIDIDSKYDRSGDLAKRWGEMVEALSPGLTLRLVVQTTMGGGYHALYRCSEVAGNQKLARRPTVHEERESSADKVRVLIETRGEGGYVLCAPTPGYRVLRGDLEAVPTITPEERAAILKASRAMDQMPPAQSSTPDGPDVTPLDDYCERCTDQEVLDMLTAAGWTVEHEGAGGLYHLKRPGKKGKGTSATYGHHEKLFYVFSTSTDFEAERGYTPAGVYAVLEHGGDFNAAARELARKGYGSGHVSSPRQQSQGKVGTQEAHGEEGPPVRVRFVRAADCLDDLDAIIKGQFGRGEPTGWPRLDRHFSVVKGRLTIVTGIPSHGKSEWLDALSVNLAMSHGWRWCVFSPENHPVALHVEKIVEKRLHRSIRKADPTELGTRYAEIVGWVNDHWWYFDATEDDLTLDMILEAAGQIISDNAIDGLILDPWNEIDATRPYGMSETEFVGKALTRIRKFSRRLGVATFVVAHPTKLRKNEDGKHVAPTLYDISGSANWRNKADNGVVVYRDDDKVLIKIEKVKYKYEGRPGETALVWNRVDGTYREYTEEDGRDFR